MTVRGLRPAPITVGRITVTFLGGEAIRLDLQGWPGGPASRSSHLWSLEQIEVAMIAAPTSAGVGRDQNQALKLAIEQITGQKRKGQA